MDATPSFGVTMISEVPSNPQLTLHEPLKITIYNQNSIDAFDSLPSE